MRKKIGRVVLVLLILSVIIASLTLAPRLQVQLWVPDAAPGSVEAFQAENEARRTLAQILGGLALLVGLYLTWRRISATERQVALVEEGQITERFTRAIDQLGSDKLDVRIGGIYALERIAHDSARDLAVVVEVLAAFIRSKLSILGHEQPEEERPTLTLDVQAVLTVMARLHTQGIGARLDLRRIDLRGFDLEEAHLEGADLSDSKLDGTRLTNAHLQGAILRRVSFGSVQLDGANLTGAEITHAKFNMANLNGAILRGATLDDVEFYSVKEFWDVDLREARLEYVTTAWVKAYRAQLQDAEIINSTIGTTTFMDADMRGAKFDGTEFSWIGLQGADIRGADLSKSRGLSKPQVEQAKRDSTTKLPAELPDQPAPFKSSDF